MAGGNTIGRVQGQSKEEDCEPQDANPLSDLFEKANTALDLVKQVQELVKTFTPEKEPEHGGDEGHHGDAGDAGDAGDEDGDGDDDSVDALIRKLIHLGEDLAPTAGSMQGAPRPDQAETQRITADLVALIRRVAGQPGSAVDRAALDAAYAEADRILRAAPSTAQARQAIDNAITASRLAGMPKPAVNVLEKVKKAFESIKGIVESAKKLLKGEDGAGVKGERKESKPLKELLEKLKKIKEFADKVKGIVEGFKPEKEAEEAGERVARRPPAEASEEERRRRGG